MSRSSTLILIGVLALILPFVGLPSAWLRILYPFLGFVVVVIGFLIRTDQVRALREATPTPQPAPQANEISPIA